MRRVAALVVAMIIAASGVPVAGRPALAAATSAGARFVAVRPVRVADTRVEQGADFAALNAGHDTSVDVLPAQLQAQLDAAPDEVVAVVVNVTLTRTERSGHLTLWQHGQPRPVVATLNAPGRFATVSNLATVTVGAGGRIGAFTNTGGELIVDVQGVYVVDAERRGDPSAGVRAGRLVPYVPTRVLDTRTLAAPLQPRQQATLSLARSVPADAIAAVLEVTATNTVRPGYVTVFPGGGRPPSVAHVSIDSAAQTRTSQVVTALQHQQVEVFSTAGGDVIVDLLGYYTGPRAPVSVNGLFHPVPPSRVLDSRSGAPLAAESVTRLAFDATTAIGTSASAVAGNVVLVDPTAPGYLTASPTGGPRPEPATAGAPVAGVTVANHATLLLGADGAIELYTRSATHAIVEIAGYFAGRPGKRLLPDARVPATARWRLGALVPADDPPVASTNFTNGTLTDGTPVERWNPCRQIDLKVNLTAATPEQT